MTRIALFLALMLSAAMPAVAQPADYRLRDETSRMAVAVLGRICLMNLGDLGATLAAASPGGEFGFVEATPDVAKTLLQERSGAVRVLRRPGFGSVTLSITTDGICTVWAELADATALQRHLQIMLEKGGMKGGAQLLPLDARDADGVRITDYYLMPTGWYAQQLGKRFGTDGTQPLALVTTVSPPGRRPMEGILAVSRLMKEQP